MNVTITVSGLRRSFGSTTALDGVDLQIGTGVTGLLGPNGAGKTTLLRILATAAGPDQGEVRILGHDPQTTEGRLAVRRMRASCSFSSNWLSAAAPLASRAVPHSAWNMSR